MKKIVVIGSTGSLDNPITNELLNAGFQVTALVRYGRKVDEAAVNNEVKFVNGDLKDKDSLKEIFSVHDGIYLNPSFNPTSKETDFQTESEGLINVIETAKVTGIKRISYLSPLVVKYDDDWWVLKMKKQAVKLLKNSGIPYTIFYPSHFMETIIQYRCGNSLMIVGDPTYPLHWIAAADFAKQVARSFEIDKENWEYIIQGPKAHSLEEAFEIFIQNYHADDLKIKKMPLGLLKYIGTFSKSIHYEAKMAECINNFPEKFEGRETWDRLGEPTMTLEEFAKQLS